MKVILVFLIIVCLISSPCFCMPVTSQPTEQKESVPVHSGGVNPPWNDLSGVEKLDRFIMVIGIISAIIFIIAMSNFDY
ncbi:hypothetical protein ACFL6F_02965 [Planctomycetota bacterium]